MPITDQQTEPQEPDLAASLVVALITRMYKTGMVTRDFADNVFYDAKVDVLQAARDQANEAAVVLTCPYRKSDPDVLVIHFTKVRLREIRSGALHFARDGRVLVQ
jgi:hypothetical protein